MLFNEIDYYDEGFLDPSELEVIKDLREWLNNVKIPENSVEPVIEKINNAPLILDVDIAQPLEEEFPAKEKAEQIIKEEIIPALKITGPRIGEKAADIIKETDRAVRVTHFSKEPLAEAYIQGLLELLEKGKKVTRIVYFHQDQPDNYQWLKRFRKDGKLLPGYRELVYKAVPTPLDFVIVDKSKALIATPILPNDHEFFAALPINGSDLVRICRNFFSLLELNSIKIEVAQHDTRLGVPEYLTIRNPDLRIIRRKAV